MNIRVSPHAHKLLIDTLTTEFGDSRYIVDELVRDVKRHAPINLNDLYSSIAFVNQLKDLIENLYQHNLNLLQNPWSIMKELEMKLPQSILLKWNRHWAERKAELQGKKTEAEIAALELPRFTFFLDQILAETRLTHKQNPSLSKVRYSQTNESYSRASGQTVKRYRPSSTYVTVEDDDVEQAFVSTAMKSRKKLAKQAAESSPKPFTPRITKAKKVTFVETPTVIKPKSPLNVKRVTSPRNTPKNSPPPFFKCVFCEQNHFNKDCKNPSVPRATKIDIIVSEGYCFNCLRKGHWVLDCPDSSKCTIKNCGRKHHAIMHDVEVTKKSGPKSTPSRPSGRPKGSKSTPYRG